MTEFLDICYDAIKKQGQAIPRTIDAVDESAASVLEGKKQIVLVGCGDSFAAADYGKWAFLRMGLTSFVVTPDEIDHYRLGDDTAVIGITASGRSLATIDALQKARARGAAIIVLTDDKDGVCSQDADYLWVTKSGVETYNTSPSAPTTTAMAYLLAVSAGLEDDSKGKVSRDIKQLGSIGKELIPWAEREGIAISKLTSPNVPIFLISEGPNYIAAQIGMMKFNEYSVLKGFVALREEFRHHFNLSINDNDSAVLITSSPTESADDTYMRVLKDTLKMRAYHLHNDEKMGLRLPLAQAIPNMVALQMAAYHSTLRHNPDKKSFKMPHAEAFKIY
jgi:glucosamine 6-phosphate synthetase-like amidotransferase/phosphosugar isomerase protein